MSISPRQWLIACLYGADSPGNALEEIVEYVQRMFLIAVARHDDAGRIVPRDHLRNSHILCVKTKNRFFEAESVCNFIPHAVGRRTHFGHNGVTIPEPGDVPLKDFVRVDDVFDRHDLRMGEMSRWNLVLQFQKVIHKEHIDGFVLASTGKRAREVDVQAVSLQG